MSSPVALRDRFIAFIAEQFPFALDAAAEAFDAVVKRPPPKTGAADAIEAFRSPLGDALRVSVRKSKAAAKAESIETIPGVSVEQRRAQAGDALVEGADGFLRRESLSASLTNDERLEILRGMLLTRAVDTRLKAF